MPSLPPIAQLLADWIEVCGFEIGRLYGKQQLGKVYEAIRREGIAEGKVKGDSEASRQKLALLLEGGQQPGEPLGRHWEWWGGAKIINDMTICIISLRQNDCKYISSKSYHAMYPIFHHKYFSKLD
jgi:hypothetical protein